MPGYQIWNRTQLRRETVCVCWALRRPQGGFRPSGHPRGRPPDDGLRHETARLRPGPEIKGMSEHSYQIDFGAKAASYVDTFMTSIRWQNADRLFEHLAVDLAQISRTLPFALPKTPFSDGEP